MESGKMTLREMLEYMEKHDYNTFKVCPVNTEGKESGICILVKKEETPKEVF